MCPGLLSWSIIYLFLQDLLLSVLQLSFLFGQFCFLSGGCDGIFESRIFSCIELL